MRVLFFLVFSVGMLCLPVGYKRLTHGFRVAKLHLEMPFRADWEFPPLEEKEILQQPFFYLARGAQCYVFESRDKKHVLKLFRYDQPINPLRRLIRAWVRKQAPKTPFREKIERLFSACGIAHTLGKEETGLAYLHLNPTEGAFSKVELHIPLGRKIYLPLDRYRFALQKRAEVARDVFARAYAKGDLQEVQRLFDALLELFERRQAKGIWNLDLNLSRNFGFIEGKAMEIDFGNYVLTGKEGLDREKELFDEQLAQWQGMR